MISGGLLAILVFALMYGLNECGNTWSLRLLAGWTASFGFWSYGWSGLPLLHDNVCRLPNVYIILLDPSDQVYVS